MQRTRLSAKGQISIPKKLRDSRAWEPGTEFTIELVDNGLLLRPVAAFPRTKLDDVAGCLSSRRSQGTATTTGEMRKAIDEEVKRRRDSGRY